MTGVLDWELASIGDPRFDLGYMSLPYSAGRFVSRAARALTGAVAERDWLERRYEAATGEPVDRAVVDLYAALGALMLFSIMGTGLALYAAGESHRYPRCMVPFRVSGPAGRPRRADGLVAT